MIHYVIREVDMGQPIVTKEIEMRDEKIEELEARMHEAEHALIVEGTKRAIASLEQKNI